MNIESSAFTQYNVCPFDIISRAKVKQTPYRTLEFQGVEATIFQVIRHLKVESLSTLRTGRLNLQEIFLVLISIRGLVNFMAGRIV
jgi:hypothetical protein